MDTGVHRPAFTLDDIQAREWVRDRLLAIGMAAYIDNAGNVWGKMADRKRAILIGSRTDTVPNRGWLDGALGVVYGIEVARTLKESGKLASVGVDVVSFQDEEGTYLAQSGSRISASGSRPPRLKASSRAAP